MAFRRKAFGSRSFWSKLGADARNMYQDEVFEKGKSVWGNDWWGGTYNTKYDSAKKGNKFKRQAEQYSQDVTAVLTGQTYLDTKESFKPNKFGFEFGFPTRAGVVQSLRKRKKKAGALTDKDKPLPDKVSRFIAKEYHKWVKKGQYNQTRTHGKGGAKTRPRKK